MNVDTLFAPFPHVRLATSADRAALSAFHRQVAMKVGPLSLAYDYDPEGPVDPTTFVSLFEDQGRLRGTASLCRGSFETGGQRVSYGYLGNLRIGPGMSPTVRTEWRRFYAALVSHAQHIEAAGCPRFLLTAVLDQNERALRFLTKHLKEVRYLPVQRYHSVTAFGPTPFARVKTSGVSFEHHPESGQVVARRDGQVIAQVTPRPAPNRTLLVTEAAWPMRLALEALSIQVPGPVKLIYFTDLWLDGALNDRQQVFEAMAHFVWREVARPAGAHGLCFASFPDFSGATFDLPRWLRMRTPGTLYEVIPRDGCASPLLQRAAKAGPLPFNLSTS